MEKTYKMIVNFGTKDCIVECVRDANGYVDCSKCKLNQKVLIGDNDVLTICDLLVQTRESLEDRIRIIK